MHLELIAETLDAERQYRTMARPGETMMLWKSALGKLSSKEEAIANAPLSATDLKQPRVLATLKPLKKTILGQT